MKRLTRRIVAATALTVAGFSLLGTATAFADTQIAGIHYVSGAHCSYGTFSVGVSALESWAPNYYVEVALQDAVTGTWSYGPWHYMANSYATLKGDFTINRHGYFHAALRYYVPTSAGWREVWESVERYGQMDAYGSTTPVTHWCYL